MFPNNGIPIRSIFRNIEISKKVQIVKTTPSKGDMKAYIVEDDESMRFILKRFLKRNFPVINLVGESETAEKALEELPTFDADVVLVDISLPGMNGIELIQQLKPNCHSVCILVVTGHEVELYKQQAYGAGAFGIVSKGEFTELLESVKRLLDIRRHGGCS